jgi:hypothetical protein
MDIHIVSTEKCVLKITSNVSALVMIPPEAEATLNRFRFHAVLVVQNPVHIQAKQAL